MNVSSFAELVIITSGKARLAGMVGLPPGAHGLLLFAHGSGSGRLSQRNSYGAERATPLPVHERGQSGRLHDSWTSAR